MTGAAALSPEGRTSGVRSALLGAAFLMATSAIGPGFLTQTAVFTQQLGASFGFAILASILADLGAQLTIWRVIAAAGGGEAGWQDAAEKTEIILSVLSDHGYQCNQDRFLERGGRGPRSG